MILTSFLVGACANTAAAAPKLSLGPVWDGPASCAMALGEGARLGRTPERLRVATWNIHWFPDGRPGNEPRRDESTDVAWLACALVYLEADVIALQEVKLTDRGRAALTEVTRRMREATGADWRYVADHCAVPSQQHLAFLYRDDRVAMSNVESHDELDPTARDTSPCSGDLRPALGAYLRSRAGGFDAHVLTVHLDSGKKLRDIKNRRAQWQALGVVSAQRQALVADSDLLVLGDFNVMGSEQVSADDELAQLTNALRALPTPLVAPAATAACTHYYKGKPGRIDIAVYSASMQEGQGAVERVSGVCAAQQCGELPVRGVPATKSLSDHCPLVVEFADKDID